MYRQEGLNNAHFIGYVDALAAIMLVFVVITAFTAISFTLSKRAMMNAQEETAQLRAELTELQDAQHMIQELKAELQQYRSRLETAGYKNIQEIPKRLEWRDAVLTKQVLENTGWAERIVELPMYQEWQEMNPPESEQSLEEIQAQLEQHERNNHVLSKAGYTDITEIPPKEDWEESQLRLKSYRNLLEEAGFEGNIDTLYDFFEQWNQIILEMKRVFKVEADEPQLVLKKLKALESLRKKVVIPVAQGSIFFGFGEVKIQDEFKQALDVHIREAHQSIENGTYDLIQIEGHTDAVPVRSDNPQYQDNWELSSARAHAVAQYFIQQGIAPAHLAVVGHAEYKPKILSESREEMARNRRIEIVFLNSSLLNLGIEE
ncbi:MAG: OmpA family protein [bacterium]|nr:OmpA family protein [bacterium]